jgi:hypothetical protein
MNRRAPLPGAAELFRPTTPPMPDTRPQVTQGGSPRQKHDTKITVYVSDEELLALEHARLALRGRHGLAVDRGRVVREAIAVLIADLDEYGENSMLVRRLRQENGE